MSEVFWQTILLIIFISAQFWIVHSRLNEILRRVNEMIFLLKSTKLDEIISLMNRNDEHD